PCSYRPYASGGGSPPPGPPPPGPPPPQPDVSIRLVGASWVGAPFGGSRLRYAESGGSWPACGGGSPYGGAATGAVASAVDSRGPPARPAAVRVPAAARAPSAGPSPLACGGGAPVPAPAPAGTGSRVSRSPVSSTDSTD